MTVSNESSDPGRLGAEAPTQVRHAAIVGMVVNLVLMTGKFVAGIAGHSQALVADAAHSFSDLATDLAVIVGVRYWSSPADANHPYGHGRIESLVSLFIGTSLALVAFGLARHAILTLPQPHTSPPGWIAFWAALASVISKEVLYRWTVRLGRRLRSPATTANAWHHRSDALSSIPVLVAVVCARVWPDLSFVDHVAAILVSVLVFTSAVRIAWPALTELIDSGAKRADRETILRIARETPGVNAAHRLRTRHTGGGLQVDLHVLVDPNLTVREGHSIAGHVKTHLLEQGPGVVDVLIHLEPCE